MTTKFNINEIFEIAIQIERNGTYFYQRCAQIAQDKSIKDLLETLAEVEIKHEQIFLALLDQVKNELHLAKNFDPDEESIQYIHAMADGHVFDITNDPASQLTGKETMEDILKTALAREKESIIYYLGLKQFVPPGLGREKVDTIIREEMTHVLFISKALQELKN